MKYLTISSLIASLFLFNTCEKVAGVKGEIDKDCTGSYLRIEDTDLRICNSNSVKDYPSGTQVKVTYSNTESCKKSNEIVCLMYREYDGDIYIKKIDRL